jgi:hypothetical protein
MCALLAVLIYEREKERCSFFPSQLTPDSRTEFCALTTLDTPIHYDGYKQVFGSDFLNILNIECVVVPPFQRQATQGKLEIAML